MSLLEDRAGYLIRRLHQIHIAIFLEECGGFGVTPAQVSVLTALADHGPLDQLSVGREVAIDRANTTAIVRRLEAKGYLVRRIGAADRRVRRCAITPAGRRLLRRMGRAVERAHERTLAALPAGERKQFMSQLRRLVNANAALSRPKFVLR